MKVVGGMYYYCSEGWFYAGPDEIRWGTWGTWGDDDTGQQVPNLRALYRQFPGRILGRAYIDTIVNPRPHPPIKPSRRRVHRRRK